MTVTFTPTKAEVTAKAKAILRGVIKHKIYAAGLKPSYFARSDIDVAVEKILKIEGESILDTARRALYNTWYFAGRFGL